MDTFNKDGKMVYVDAFPRRIVFAEDLEFFSKIKDKYIKIKKTHINETMSYLDQNIKDLKLLKDIQNGILNSMNRIIKFTIVDIKVYHKLQISTVIKQDKQDTLYIGTGDTIFSSSWVIGAGLNRLLYFIKKPIWSLQLLSKEL